MKFYGERLSRRIDTIEPKLATLLQLQEQHKQVVDAAARWNFDDVMWKFTESETSDTRTQALFDAIRDSNSNLKFCTELMAFACVQHHAGVGHGVTIA